MIRKYVLLSMWGLIVDIYRAPLLTPMAGAQVVPYQIYSRTHKLSVQISNHYQLPFKQSNGSMTCPFAGAVTAGNYNEGIIYLPLRWIQRWQEWQGSEKCPWEWLAEVAANLVILVTLVMEGVLAGHWHAHLQCLTDMPCMTLGGHWQALAMHNSMATHSARQPVWS